MQINVDNASTVTFACVILHNLLIKERPAAYLQKSAVQPIQRIPTDVWQDEDVLLSMQRTRGNTDRLAGLAVRDHLKNYLNHVGTVPWQDRAVDSNVFVS